MSVSRVRAGAAVAALSVAGVLGLPGLAAAQVDQECPVYPPGAVCPTVPPVPTPSPGPTQPGETESPTPTPTSATPGPTQPGATESPTATPTMALPAPPATAPPAQPGAQQTSAPRPIAGVLPRTGATAVVPLGAAGLVLVAAGTAAVLVTRRRRLDATDSA
jgi:LPXTG-motif cell wall-anchored protein